MSDREHSQNTVWAETLSYVTRKHFPVKKLAAAADIKQSTVYKLRDGAHNPRWSEAAPLLKVMPNTACNQIFRPLGFAVQALVGDRCDHTTLASLCRTSAEFADALEDGRIDNRERGQIRPFVEGVRNLCDAWLAEENPATKQLTLVGKCT